jgi:hypothetical protein
MLGFIVPVSPRQMGVQGNRVQLMFDWPLHVAEQEWTHLEAFLDAFAYALPRFCPKEFDTDRLARSVTEARRVKRLYQA